MSDPISMDIKGFDKLQIILKNAPAKFQSVVASMLNDLAFRARPIAVSTIASRYIMRSPKFILSRMRVEKAQPVEIQNQKAIVGSTFVRGKTGKMTFDGFAEIAGVKIGETRSRTFTLLARGGTEAGITKRGARLMPGQDIPKPDDWDEVQAPQSRVQAMIRAMASSGVYGKTFIIPKGNALSPGLYKVKNKRGYALPSGRSAPKIQQLQHFDHNPKAAPWNWLLESMVRTIKYAPLQKMWADAMNRIMKR